MIKTNYQKFKSLAKLADRVVLCQELDFELLTPTQAYDQLEESSSCLMLLEFTPSPDRSYAFLGLHPMAELIAKGRTISLRKGDQLELLSGDPFSYLRKLKAEIQCADHHPLSKLTGSPIGYVGYDAIRYIEPISDRHESNPTIADIDMKFYRTGITFDKVQKTTVLTHIVDIDKDNLMACYHAGMAFLAEMVQKLYQSKNLVQQSPTAKNPESDFESDLSNEEFAATVKKAKEYIARGDAFQIVSSRRFYKKYSGNAFDIYRSLKKVSPAPYHFYFRNEKFAFAGASPEKIVSVRNGNIEIAPLAGTRPRLESINDALIAEELLRDPKEIAEHMMLVDLARNDLGRTSIPGSIKVIELLKPISFSHIIHIVSIIQGKIKKENDIIDVLRSSFPAGTLSGAPKISAMHIIDEIESSSRGLYGGGVVVLDRDNNLDTAILIRTAVIENGVVQIRTGAGIVHDSNPTAESDETYHKARSVMAAVRLAEMETLS